jgi:putative NADH-flavin reductase
VFGASGPTGREIVQQALTAGHSVTAFVRDPAKLAVLRPGLEIVSGDVTSRDGAVTAAVGGADAVLSALGVRDHGPTTVYSQRTTSIADAMKAAGARRLICISSAGMEIPPGAPITQRLVMKQLLQRVYRHPFADMAAMEHFLEGTDLTWTVVRAPRLRSGPRTGTYRVCIDEPLPKGRSITRADLADFMIQSITEADTFKALAFVAY